MDWVQVAAVVIPTAAVGLSAWFNHRAHAGITERIGQVDARIDGVDERAAQRSDAHRTALESIARDVSFMAGRQTERDNRAN